MEREQNGGSARKRAKCNTSAATIQAPNETMAEIVGMAPAASPPRVIRDITYTCPCGRLCRQCEVDIGGRIADVDDWSVTIGDVTYDRGIESEARIAAALESVDEHCREDLEWLLRNGQADSAEMQVVVARAESEPRPAKAPVLVMDTLAAVMFSGDGPVLKPRAIAVLVTLRGGGLSDSSIAKRISDTKHETILLLRDMLAERLVACGAGRWWLDDAGIAWLEREGLSRR